jgi:hypothetical protein
MLDAKGSPVGGVCMDLEPLEGRGEDGARFFNCSKPDGRFEMTMMPPGKYWLVARDEVKLDRFESKSTLYFPGVRYREQSTVISIEAGKYIRHLEMRLPTHEKRDKLTGRMQFADGAPVDGATVIFTSPQHGYSETTVTGTDGSFGLSALAGIDGQLNGQFVIMERILKSCPGFAVGPRRSGMLRFMDAKPITLSIDSTHEDVILELASRSCKFWPPGQK